jgi:hypothetical protein
MSPGLISASLKNNVGLKKKEYQIQEVLHPKSSAERSKSRLRGGKNLRAGVGNIGEDWGTTSVINRFEGRERIR